ncbi:hypothetical protein DES40_2432 [Litorimonas taeanensis]|uniref:Uncharacterized protein n=1 Tax=Litorimonas taeanensis TaxID=568099 RepID=A0A420WF89_9PROT|nr:hypothetical protein [Litorimonas taeanensis]RKQ69629.1 hypothetical protein DES40_2432 [Litorimonas taeanensis]
MSSRAIIGLAILLTILLTAVTVAIGFTKYCEPNGICISNFAAFLQSPPNEKGDTLAGLAGSLAFLWIITTVLLQSKELALQREELERTRTTLEKQTLFLANQDEDRKTKETDETINAKLKSLLKELPEVAFDRFLLVKQQGNETELKRVTFLTKENLSLDTHTSHYTNAIISVERTIMNMVENGWVVDDPTRPKSWFKCSQLAKEICDDLVKGSRAKYEEVINEHQIEKLAKALNDALRNEIIWEKSTSEIQS